MCPSFGNILNHFGAIDANPSFQFFLKPLVTFKGHGDQMGHESFYLFSLKFSGGVTRPKCLPIM
jgi:hypothetical protein